MTPARIILAIFLLCPLAARPQVPSDFRAPEPPKLEWNPPLGEPLPLAIEVLTSSGDVVPLGHYFGQTPVFLMLGYNACPMLCAEQVRGFLEAAPQLALEPGDDYRFLFFSIDAEESATAAREAELTALRALRAGPDAVHFLRGGTEAIRELTQATGFEWTYDPGSGQFAHHAGILVASPTGTLTHRFGGVRYSPSHLEMAAVEASHGTVGTLGDSLRLLCYQYDPMSGRYGLAVSRLLTFGAVATIVGLGLLVWWAQRRARRPAPSL